MRAWLAVLLCFGCDSPSVPSAEVPESSTDALEEQSTDLIGDGAFHPPVGPSSSDPPDAVAPPTFPCADAGPDASACAPPPAVCVDDEWLEYFDNGKCVDGMCSFTPKLHWCYFRPGSCVDGVCHFPGVTAPN